jgi:hypothetical protein
MIVTGDIPEDLEIVAVITVEPVEGAEPEKASFILIDATDRIIGKTLFDTKVPHFLGFEPAGKQ